MPFQGDYRGGAKVSERTDKEKIDIVKSSFKGARGWVVEYKGKVIHKT